MPQVKPTVTGCGMWRISEPSLSDSRQGQHDAGKEDRQQQALDPKFRDSRRDQYDERPGRAADLEPASAQRGYDKAANDRGVETPVGRHARTDRNRHRKRQRHDGDREPSHRVAAKLAKSVALTQNGGEFRLIKVSGGGPVRHLVSNPFPMQRSGNQVRLPAEPSACVFPPGPPPRSRKNRAGSQRRSLVALPILNGRPTMFP